MKNIIKFWSSFITYLTELLPLKNIFLSFIILGSYRFYAICVKKIPTFKLFSQNFTVEETQQMCTELLPELLASEAEFAKNWQTTFPKPASLGLESIQIFHSDIWLILGTIFFTVAYVGIEAIIRFDAKKATQEAKNAKLVEFLWTMLPIFIIFFIVIPSFALMYMLDINPAEVLDLPSISVNVTGNQWYWQYEIDISGIIEQLDLCSDLLKNHEETLSKPITLDSYMLPTVDLEPGSLRGLVATNTLVLPEGVEVQVYGNSKDVIHSWTVSGFDVKLDTVPGRINSASCNITKTGTFFGQCSELCGTNHGFMPIQVEVLSAKDFTRWVERVLEFRASNSGLSGLIKYVARNYGDAGHPYNVCPEKVCPLRDNTFRGEWAKEMYERQAQILQRFRLINQFKEWLGFEVDHNESHLLLQADHKIYKIPNEKGFYYQDKPEYTAMVDRYLYDKWKDQFDRAQCEYLWNKCSQGTSPSAQNLLGPQYMLTTTKPVRAQTMWFPWRYDQIQAVEPSCAKGDYAITLPDALSFVSCKNQRYGPNFTSWDNCEGNCWYFWWYLSSEWINGVEYQILMHFPKNFGLNGGSVYPVMPYAHWEHDTLNFKQELGWRFLTKKLRTWTTPETPTVLVEGFNGQIRDTGVPIDEIWCAKFRFQTELPPRVMWFRHSAHNNL